MKNYFKCVFVCGCLALALTGCDRPGTLKASGYTKAEGYEGTVEIDSCEYLQIRANSHGAWETIYNYVHKGNCKYCIDRGTSWEK